VKYNTKRTGTNRYANRPDATLNYEGALSFKPSTDKLALFKGVVSCFFGEPKFYQTADESVKELKGLAEKVAKEDPDFVLRLAILTRNYFNLRTVSLFLLSVVVNVSAGNFCTYKAIAKTITRADELTELIAMNDALYPRRDGKNKMALPQAIKKGVALAFRKFNEYNLAKYDRKTKVTLKDAMILTHPTPKDKKQGKLFGKLLDDKLATPKTWETFISVNGSTKENWQKILPEMGIFAFVRNLRNLTNLGVDISGAIEKFKTPEAIKRSRMLPFRFYQAWNEISHTESKNFLEYAVNQSVANLEKWDGKTLVLVDLSGSMTWTTLSGKSTMKPAEISALFGALIHEMFNDKQAVIVPFASGYKVLNLDSIKGVLNKADAIRNCGISGGTYAHQPINHMYDLNYEFDRIILLSDGDVWSSESRYGRDGDGIDSAFVDAMTRYRNQINKDTKLYMFDLTGYNHMVLPEDNRTVLIGGWSDRIFQFIRHMETAEEESLKLVYTDETEYKKYTL